MWVTGWVNLMDVVTGWVGVGDWVGEPSGCDDWVGESSGSRCSHRTWSLEHCALLYCPLLLLHCLLLPATALVTATARYCYC